ncbi:retrovirus-related pol polyprotein from transposon TNT 1-94 [Tanacetum coccineum]
MKRQSKRKKTDSDLEEKEHLKTFMKIVPDEEGIIDFEVLEKRFPIINSQSKFYHFDRHGAECIYYRIFRSDGSSRWIKTFSEMVTRFDRLDLVELFNLVMQRFETTTLQGIYLVLWGDLRTMFEANTEDELWHNQERWNLKSWDFYENCGVHTLTQEDGIEIHMLIERKYPLTKETLERMMSLKWISRANASGKDFLNLLMAIVCQKLYGSQLTMLRSKELASPKQTTLGKDFSNPLMADSLPKTICADNHPPMLDKPQYESWKSRMKLYIQGKDNGRIILNSVENGPIVWPTVVLENGTVRPKTYEELSNKEKFHADYDLKATNILLQGLPPDIYALVNHHPKLVIQLTLTLLLCLPPEWGKFVTDVKLARDLHTSNYDQFYAYLEQHEVHANETRLMHERFLDPLALFSPPTQHVYSLPPQSNPYGAPHHPQQYPTTYPTNLSHTQPSVTQNAYPPPIIPQQPQVEFPQIDSGLAVPTFLLDDDPIACSRGNTSGQAKIIKCYSCQGEGHMARQCTQPKRRKDATWFKEKVLLVQAHDKGKELYEEQLAFLADPKVADDVLSEVQYSDTFQNDNISKSVQGIPQKETNCVVQNTNTSAQQKSMILSMFEQMSNHATNWDKANNESKIVNESLTVELDRYKKRVKILEQ